MYKSAMEIDPFHANSIYNYGVLCDSGLRNQTLAESLYRRCLLVSGGKHSFALYNLAVMLEEVRGGTKEGKAEVNDLFKKAAEAAPRDSVTIADYGRFLMVKCNEIDKAECLLRRSVELNPDCVVGNYNLGVLLFSHREDHAGAETLFNHVLRIETSHIESMRCLARISQKRGGIERAEKWLKKALKLAEGDAKAEVKSDIEKLRKKS